MKNFFLLFFTLLIFSPNLYSQSWDEINKKAIAYYKKGDYKNALSYALESVRLAKTEFGDIDINYATSLNDLAIIYDNMGQYEKAEPLYEESNAIYRALLGDNHPYYAISLNNLAVLYQKLGQFEKAEPYYKESMRIIKEVSGEKHPDYATSLNNLAGLYRDWRLYDKAEPLYKESLKIYKEIFGEEHPYYALSLNNLAELYRLNGKYDLAEPLFKEAIKIRKKTMGEKHPDYAMSLCCLGVLYFHLNQYDKAITYYKESMKITEKVFGKKHPGYTILLDNLAGLYFFKGDYKEAEPLFIEENDNNIDQLNNNFTFLSENQKSDFLNTIYYEFEIFYSFINKRSKENPSIVSNMLDARLASKGIILSSTVQMFNKIKCSDNEDLMNQYNKLIAIKTQLIKLKDLSVDQQDAQKINIAKLESDVEEIEKELSTSAGIKAEKKVTWKDLKNSLKPNEVAIEFINFKLFNKKWTDTTLYVAIILRNDYKYPKLINLCTEEGLKSYLNISAEKNSSYVKNENTSNNLYNLIFKPLEEELKGAEKIYISPSGMINRISLNALTTETGELLIDKYNIYYTGNLKDIVNPETENKINQNNFNTAIFGGAEFNLDSVNIIANLNKYKNDTNNIVKLKFPDSLKESYNREMDIRGGKWNYLKGTLTEADEIKVIFEQNNISTEEFTGADASEEALKSLCHSRDKNSPTVLHIATHG
ncbi:MAG: tetratricopeptide repeat protein, partial [Ignavibacteriae bacterium]|nr:tetratricopeptide repeat protein [Ignavibacteriota bacterium]